MSRGYKLPSKWTTANATKLLADRSYYDIETIIRNRLHAAPHLIKRLDFDGMLEGHTGCVNCLEWSSDGRVLASSSDDLRVILWDPFRKKQLFSFLTPHQGNVFSVKYLPGTTKLATCAADCAIYVYDLYGATAEISPSWKCHCHQARVKRLATAGDTPFLFWSASEDGNVYQFDIREKHSCKQNDKIQLLSLPHHMGSNAEAKCLAVNQRRSELIAVGANDVYARLYDRRMLTLSKTHTQYTDTLNENCATYFCPGHLNKVKDGKDHFSNKAITYLTFSPDGTELLVNMGAEQIYLYDINNAKIPVHLSMPQFNRMAANNQSANNTDDDAYEVTSPPSTVESEPETESPTSSTTTTATFIRSAKLPEHIEMVKRNGNDFLENEKYLAAINQYTKAIHLLPNHPVAYLNRATAYMRRNWYGDVYAGLRDCQTALKLDPTYVKAMFRLARALFELGYVDEANDCLQELKKRFPSHVNNNGVKMLTKDIQIQQTKNELMDTSDTSEEHVTDISSCEMHWRMTSLDYAERFVGHCNTTTDIKEANFFGNNGNFVIAGSDDGNIFIWERPTDVITNVYKGDMAIVNCIQPHPFYCLMATSGIDNEIRIWTPQSDEPNYVVKNKVEHYENAVQTNQHRMQADPFDLRTPGTICRSS